MREERRGFSLIDMLVVVCVISICLAILAPKFRVGASPSVVLAADQLVTDLEQVRTKALTAPGNTRVVITTATNRYTAYLDDNGDGVINEVATETAALRGLRTRILTDNVIFGRGAAPQLPGFPGAGASTFTANRVDFNTRGVTSPFGARGAVYFTSSLNNGAVAAVTVTPGGGIRRWVYLDGTWR